MKHTFLFLLFISFIICSLPNQIDISHNDEYSSSMLWGSYRPGIYFGMKTRMNNPIMTGLMWSSAYKSNIRHLCRHEDHMQKYSWIMHNGIDFGKHEVIDTSFNTKVTASFIKELYNDKFGGSWSNRIRFQKLQDAEDTTSFLYYFIFPEECSIEMPKPKKKGIEKVLFSGSCQDYGKFTFSINEQDNSEQVISDTQKSSVLQKYHMLGLKLSNEDSWNIEDKVKSALYSSFNTEYQKYTRKIGEENINTSPKIIPLLPNTIELKSNVFIFQRISHLPVTFDIAFIHHESISGTIDIPSNKLQRYINTLIGDELTQKLHDKTEEYENIFDKKFHLKEAQGFDERVIPCSKVAISNMIGGIGYWYGPSLIYQGSDKEPLERESYPLISACPSRPFFPRGFLWDEGFHQLLISEWNPQISMDIIKHWFNLMDETGWIPREQILGSEARSRVPHEFQPQHRDHANPPAFFLTIDKLLRKFHKKLDKLYKNTLTFSDESNINSNEQKQLLISSDKELNEYYKFFNDIYPRLSYWYTWFLSSQKGIKDNMFRWRGRTKDHTLSSGLDDFPRSSYPIDTELHVDLLSWLTFSSKVLSQLSKTIGVESNKYDNNYSQFLKSLDIHWDETKGIHCDIVNITSNPIIYSKHIGYVNLFPLMLGLIPNDSPQIPLILKYVKDSEYLFTKYGIRSLSKQDSYYQQGENYWRGPIWINMNYIFISSLKLNYFKGPYEAEIRNIYSVLRTGVVNNIINQYQLTGYLWEQYNEETGKGQRSHPFTGWSALVLNIISELY